MAGNRSSWHVAGAALGLGGSVTLALFDVLLRPPAGGLSVDNAPPENFGSALLFFSLLALGLYCLNAAVERAVPTAYCCSPRQMPEPVPRTRALARRPARP